MGTLAPIAEVVELVDTLASGASGGNPVEVRVLFSVPLKDGLTILNGSQTKLNALTTLIEIDHLNKRHRMMSECCPSCSLHHADASLVSYHKNFLIQNPHSFQATS